jgi:hypothetical protein
MTTRASIATIAVGMVLAVVSAPAAQAGPGQMSPEAYQALHRRSLALNVIYGLGKPAEVTQAQYRASLIRSAALNERYGLRSLSRQARSHGCTARVGPGRRSSHRPRAYRAVTRSTGATRRSAPRSRPGSP